MTRDEPKPEPFGSVPGGELNSRPTPKAFGAALWRLPKSKDGGAWILFRFQSSFNSSRLRQRLELLAHYNFQVTAESLGCVSVSAKVLEKTGVKIDGRANIVATVCAAEDVDPGHRELPGGELNSRPRAYESPALPLSYPGVNFRISFPRSRPTQLPGALPTPKAFGAALPLGYPGVNSKISFPRASSTVRPTPRLSGLLYH